MRVRPWFRSFRYWCGPLWLAGSLAAGQSDAPRSNRPPAPVFDQASVTRGKELFTQNCSFCHGKDANGGDGGPDLMRSVLVNHDVNGDLIGPVVVGGRPDKGMPKFPMTQAQVVDIATFLHARNQYIRQWSHYQVKVVVTGDAAAGERYFKGSAGCATCHSPGGDLAHVAQKYDPETLLKHMLYPAGRPPSDNAPMPAASSPMTVTATVKLPTGETVSGPLRHIDEFSVSLYDASGDYRTWDRDKVQVELHDPLEKHVALLARYTDDDMHNLLAYLETLK